MTCYLNILMAKQVVGRVEAQVGLQAAQRQRPAAQRRARAQLQTIWGEGDG